MLGGLRRQLVPDAALVGHVAMAGANRAGDPRRLLLAHRGEEGGVAGREVATAVTPTPLLDAAHRDRQLRLRGHEHRGVEDAVLLRADQLLAVEEEQRLVGEVDDLELRDGPRLVRLRDAHPVAGLDQN